MVLGVDDVASECDLDAVTDWDWILTNNGEFDDENLQDLEQWIHSNLWAIQDSTYQLKVWPNTIL